MNTTIPLDVPIFVMLKNVKIVLCIAKYCNIFSAASST
jgi:hypothetical protein